MSRRWAPLVLLLGTGCASYSTFLDPRPTPPGVTEVGVQVSALALDRGLGRGVLPVPELTLRRGLAPGVDLGGKLGPLGLEVSSRLALLEQGRFRLGVVPGLGIAFAPLTTDLDDLLLGHLSLGLIGGVELGDVVTLYAGPRAFAQLSVPPVGFPRGFEGARAELLPGGLLGLRLSVSGRVALVPEIAAFARGRGGAPLIQGGLALQLIP